MAIWPTTVPLVSGFDSTGDNLSEAQAYIEYMARHVIQIIQSHGQPDGFCGLDGNGKVPESVSWPQKVKFLHVASTGVATVKPAGWQTYKRGPGMYTLTWPDDVPRIVTAHEWDNTVTVKLDHFDKADRSVEVNTLDISDYTTLLDGAFVAFSIEAN